MVYSSDVFFEVISPTYIYLTLGLLSVYALLHQLFLRPLFFSPLRHVPGPRFGHPLYGQFKNIVTAEAGTLQREWAEKYGPVVRAIGPLGVERMMFLTPNALQRILVTDWINYPRPDFLRNILGISAGYGLLTVTGTKHKQMRRAMNPAFSLPNLMAQTDMYYPPLEGLVKVLYDRIGSQPSPEAGVEVEMYDWMSKVTLDIICDTAFGYHTDSVHNPHNELALAYHELINLQSGSNIARFVALLTIPGFPRLLRSDFAYRNRQWLFRGSFLSPSRTLLSAMHRINAVAREMLKEKLAEADVKDAASKRDIMSLLVRARMNEKGDGYRMSDQDLVEQVLTFLGAGHETTASGLSWTLWLLAKSQEAQNRLRTEVTPIIQNNPRPDYRTLKDLQWLDCVVMESLRVLPPVPMTVRKVQKDDWVEGLYLPKGTLLYIPIRVVNTWSKIWGDDAQEFRPERWLNLPSTYNPTFSLLSFITGPHACIGRTMAIMEMKAILAILIAHFTFEPAYEGQMANPTAAITMKPADTLPLRVKIVGNVGT
ncbi:cytochrome P450 [Gautieria morchelliformis]|nr:cytochrome P450 [Gautieria morchelliformis]